MNFREKLKKVLELLGLSDKFEKRELSQEEWSSIVNRYQQEYQTTVRDDMDADNKTAADQDAAQKLLNSIYQMLPSQESDDADTEDDEHDGNGKGNGCDGKKKNRKSGNQNVTLEDIQREINGMKSQIKTLSSLPDADVPVQVVNASPISVNGFATSSDYLFGVEHPMFSMKDRWNKIAANPRAALSMPDADEESDGKSFRKAVREYARSLASRYSYLQQNKMLDVKGLQEGTFSTNFDGVTTSGVGDQFIIRRQDALIARVLALRVLTGFFPVRYGVQDRDILFNTFFDEVSQPYQEGEVYKGGMKIENEIGYVDDAMVKVKFGPMKNLERMYIAYLNKEGSDPIKWSMIEYCILHELETMQAEQNKRRIRGIYVKPEAGVASSYLNAGTGILYTLLRYIHEYSIKPTDDADKTYHSYQESTMLYSVQSFCSDVMSNLSEDEEINSHVIYLNERHKPWWIKNIRETYGKDIDFQGPGSYLNVVPDTGIQIRWLPYLGNICFMMMDIPGNLQFIEYVPGEMFNIKMEEQMEMVRAWSTWKEGCGAAFTGKKFDTKEAMDDNNFEWQQIFTNVWASDVAPDATTIDGGSGFWFLTGKNTQATSITDITNAKNGVAYCIEVGSAVNASKIAKSGKFASITSAFNPTKEGDYLMVIARSDGNFAELERRVGGVRTINKLLQPNVPGAR